MLHPAYEIVGDRHHERPLVVTCEHASNRLPEEIEASPEDRPWLETHWGWDPGAAAVTRALIEHKDCVAIMSRFSRLVCDPNRHVEEWDWIRERCEDYELSFNRHLSDEERQRRRATYHEPFHAEVDACLSERLARGGLSCFVDAFVEAEVVLRRFAHLVVEVARDDLRRVAVWISLALHAMVIFLLHLHAVDATLLGC